MLALLWWCGVVLTAPGALAGDASADAVSGSTEAGRALDARALRDVPVEWLVLAVRVWGFTATHHPALARGRKGWDPALITMLAEVAAAETREGALDAMARPIRDLGAVAPCDPCAALPVAPHRSADVDWLTDTAMLGTPLSSLLREVYANRPTGSRSTVSRAPEGHVELRSEADPADASELEARLLTVARAWNALTWWSPHRDRFDEPWSGVLAEAIRDTLDAPDTAAFHRAMLRLLTHANDGHTNLWGALDARPPAGDCALPVWVRFVEGQAVVRDTGPGTTLRPGDVLTSLDGADIVDLIRAWAPLYAASNDAAKRRDMAGRLTVGACGPVWVGGLRAGAPFETAETRIAGVDLYQGPWAPRPERLADPVALLDLTREVPLDARAWFSRHRDVSALIIDLRGAVHASVVFAVGRHLVGRPTECAAHTLPDLDNPSATVWAEPVVLRPRWPRFRGRVAILVDERTQGAAEYHALVLRAAPGAVVVGSRTAGADGNPTTVELPGGLRMAFTGVGVFTPSGRATQGLGIIPDIAAHPTPEGMAEGRDEVLEAALRFVAPELDEAERQRVARWPRAPRSP